MIVTLTVLSVCNFLPQTVVSKSSTSHPLHVIGSPDHDKKKISLDSNRGSADMPLLFPSDEEGQAVIIVLKEAGKMKLEQTNRVTNSIDSILLKNATGLAEGYSCRVGLISNDKFIAPIITSANNSIKIM
ncbi:MAG: hypothetical protein ABIO77_01480 [Ginsengibacter sp.]